MPTEIAGVTLVHGRATGPVLLLDEPLSFWGGVDASTGAIIDTHHPQLGKSIAGHVLVLPSGRGSSSSSSVLAEAIRDGVGPAAILLGRTDPILVIGCLVAEELYGRSTPIVVLDDDEYATCAAAVELSVDAGDDQAIVRVRR